ncbi:MAG: hypothetical protein FD123_4038 [Bacteroidetes bacterium]|nr:MAG: hypothetical protein FD123_4038 [Bacteroidota bacterium]
MRTPYLLFILLFTLQGYAQGVINPGDGYYSRLPKPVVLHVVQEKGDCVFGLKNDSNEWVVSPQYKHIEKIEYSDHDDARFWKVTREGLLYGLLDSAGKELFAPKYQDIEEIWPYRNYFSFRKEEMRGVIDHKGQIIIPALYDDIKWYDPDHHLFLVERYDSSAVFGVSGKIIMPLSERHLVGRFKKGKAVFMKYDDTLKTRAFGCIDTSGTIIIPGAYDSILCVSGDIAPARIGKKWGVLGLKNETLHPFEFDGIIQLEADSLFRMTSGGKQRLMDKHGKWLISTACDSIGEVSRAGIVPARQNGSWKLFDCNKKQMLRLELDTLEAFRTKQHYTWYRFAVARMKGKYGLLDDSGNWVVQPAYDYMGWYNSRKYDPYRDTLWVYSRRNAADTNGSIRFFRVKEEYVHWGKYVYKALPVDYAAIAKSDVNVFRSSRYSIVAGRDGKLLLPPQPYSVRKETAVDFIITGEKGIGVIRSDGKWMVPPVMKLAGRLVSMHTTDANLVHNKETDPYYYVKTSTKKIGIYDTSGNLLVDTAFEQLSLTRHAPDPGVWVGQHKASKAWLLIGRDGKTLATSYNKPVLNGKYILIRRTKSDYLFSLRTQQPVPGVGFRYMVACGENRFTCSNGHGVGLTDGEGRKLLPRRFTYIENVSENVWLVKAKNRNGLCDSTGNWLVPLSDFGLAERTMPLETVFTGDAYWDSVRPSACRSDTMACIPGAARFSWKGGSYDLLAPANEHPYRVRINNFIIREIIYKTKDMIFPQQRAEIFNRNYANSSTESNYFIDYQLAAFTPYSFTLRIVSSQFQEGKLYNQNEEFHTYFINTANAAEPDARALFLPQYEDEVMQLVLDELKKKTGDNFAFHCGKPGKLIYDDYLVTGEGLEFRFVNKSQDLEYLHSRFEPQVTVGIKLSYAQLKTYADPNGWLPKVYGN